MGTQLYNIGITGLNAAQAAMVTTGHNISNVSTAGYTRQQVILGTNDPQMTGSGFLGQGARVETVRRIYSQFLTAQVMEARTQSSEYDAFAEQIGAHDNLLADEQAGMSPAMTDFFDAIQSVTASPTSLAARQSVISSAQAMTARFNSLDLRMEQVGDQIKGEISGAVGEINQLVSQIARYNDQIAVAQSTRSPQAGRRTHRPVLAQAARLRDRPHPGRRRCGLGRPPGQRQAARPALPHGARARHRQRLKPAP